MSERKGDWIQTFTGKQFWPVDPQIDDVDILDIAHALSMQCRFAGHCLRFYSVAEHCVLLMRAVPANYKLEALMHDASEAYLTDVPRPTKPFLSGYYELEDAVQKTIAARFGFAHPTTSLVKEADRRILTDEAAQNMAAPPVAWSTLAEPLGVSIENWMPQQARHEFLRAFQELYA